MLVVATNVLYKDISNNKFKDNKNIECFLTFDIFIIEKIFGFL